jgi:hypothetical protein
VRYTDAVLDALRLVGDPIPDQIIAELDRDGQIDAVNRIMRELVTNDQQIPEELPDNIEFWLRDTAALPDWADRARLDRAAALFEEHGVTISLILATASLVECYAAVKGVKVLTFSYRLGQNAYRRVAETAQFVLLVMAPGGLYPGGQGVKAIQKVRLMHAAVRHMIGRTGRWDERELGVPICQEDLLGTLMSFSTVVLRDLRRLGIQLQDQEAADYYYLWRVLGEMMGCDPAWIPEELAEAELLTDRIATRHFGPSPEGIAMTKALLEMHADLIPGQLFDGIIPALVRHLVGDQIADWMEVPYSRWAEVVERAGSIGRILDSAQRTSNVFRNVVNRLGQALLTRQAIALAGYQRAAFAIPTELRQSWHLDEEGGDEA